MTATATTSTTDTTSPPAATSGEPLLRCEDGSTIELDVAGWSADADPVDERLVAGVSGPVLDIGCGPGRLVEALAARGIPALGVDASPVAVGRALARQAPALLRSVFDPLPGTGRWRTALLMDGNIGIGGDPQRLLARTAELLGPAGSAVVEVAPAGAPTERFRARVEGHGTASAWFPWARVGADDVAGLGATAGLRLEAISVDSGRWFARLVKATAA